MCSFFLDLAIDFAPLVLLPGMLVLVLKLTKP